MAMSDALQSKPMPDQARVLARIVGMLCELSPQERMRVIAFLVQHFTERPQEQE